jgi:Tfp pilus assembly protein PilN
MIEINLLPGAKKSQRSRGGTSINVGDLFRDLGSRIRDPFLLAAIGSTVVSVSVVGFLFTSQAAQVSDLTEREQKAVQDSTRYHAVIRERQTVLAQRDSVLRQIRIIQAIDGTRFIWPHLMDEVSRAVPPFTWVTTIVQTSPQPALAPEVEAGIVGPTGGAPMDADSLPLSIAVTGNTLDIQALTRFMRLLEASPFLQNVTLARSDVIVADGKNVTNFRLDMLYQRPDSASIRTYPFTVSTR